MMTSPAEGDLQGGLAGALHEQAGEAAGFDRHLHPELHGGGVRLDGVDAGLHRAGHGLDGIGDPGEVEVVQGGDVPGSTVVQGYRADGGPVLEVNLDHAAVRLHSSPLSFGQAGCLESAQRIEGGKPEGVSLPVSSRCSLALLVSSQKHTAQQEQSLG